MLLFAKEDAFSFIDACKTYNISILGIDSFFLFDDKIQPSLDNSIDFSSNYYKPIFDDIYTESKEFIRHKDEKLYFEIVCKE